MYSTPQHCLGHCSELIVLLDFKILGWSEASDQACFTKLVNLIHRTISVFSIKFQLETLNQLSKYSAQLHRNIYKLMK